MKVKSLDDLLVLELKDLYSAEKQIVKALPKIIKNVTNENLKKGLEKHLAETEGQVARLDDIALKLEVKLSGHVCKAMKGLLEEGDDVMGDVDPGPVLDAAIIGACQRVEHYEIAAYGTARAYAEQLGNKEVAKLLQETLDEEGNANKVLTKASTTVNQEAEAQTA